MTLSAAITVLAWAWVAWAILRPERPGRSREIERDNARRETPR